MNRRTVLLGIGVGVATLAATLGGVRALRKLRHSRAAAKAPEVPPREGNLDQAAQERESAHVELPDVEVPYLLFFPERRSTARSARTGAVARGLKLLSGSTGKVEVLFSTGEVRDLRARVSAAQLRLQGDDLSSVQLKNLAAWLFESWWQVKRKPVADHCLLLHKNKDLAQLQEEAVYYRSLIKDFARLQEETVLDHVTPATLVAFGARLASADRIRSVAWSDGALVVR